MGDAAMEAVEWVLATVVGILLLLVLMLALLVTGAWLLRQLLRIWSGTPPTGGGRGDAPS
jgi:hypothetical protein